MYEQENVVAQSSCLGSYKFERDYVWKHKGSIKMMVVSAAGPGVKTSWNCRFTILSTVGQ